MKKFLICFLMISGIMTMMPEFVSARNSADEKLVKELSGGLPVYMGNGMTWTQFDIDKDGEFVISLLSNNLPDVYEIDDDLRAQFKDALTGPNSGYTALSKNLGRKIRIKVFNSKNDLCIFETVSPQ